MTFISRRLLCITLGLMAGTASAESVESILEKMQALQIERWEGVERYIVEQTVMGNRVAMAFERGEVQASDGKTYPVFLPMQQGSMDPATRDFMAQYSTAAKSLGDGLGSEMDEGMARAGLPPGLLSAGGGDPWASADPRVMMGGMARFADEVAQAPDASSSPQENAAASVEGIAQFARHARLLGKEKIDGRQAFHLRAEGLKQIQKSGDDEFVLDTVNMWIDTREYVPLKMRMEGVATSAGESRPLTIERTDSDYRTVKGSSMYESFQQKMRIAGVMTAEEEKQMQEAQVQMADMEEQLAAMPASQRDMILQQMGPQLEMMRSMAAGNGMEMTITVNRILVNPDAADLQLASPAPVGFPSGSGSPSSSVATQTAAAGSPGVQPAPDESELQAAQQACLTAKMEQAQEAQQTKRGFGRLLGAAGRLAGRFGGPDVSQTMHDVYTADATAADISAAAKDLGLTDDDIEACKNPG